MKVSKVGWFVAANTLKAVEVGATFWVLLVALVAATPARATVLLSENFNAVALGTNASSIGPNFTVQSGTVDVIGTGFFDFYPGNGHYLDLDGSTLQLGTIGSNSFGPGTYTLSFDLSAYTYNNQYITEQTKVTLGNFSTIIVPTVDSSVTPGAPMQHWSLTFTTTASGPLLFEAINLINPGQGTNVGNILDNVQLATAVPEPESWAMIIIGFLGLGLLAHRRQSGEGRPLGLRSVRALAGV